MRKIQFVTLEIEESEIEEYSSPKHQHSFYEIIYIRKGSGVHVLNNNQFSYKKDDVFILSPEDNHYFEVEKRTEITFIMFTDNYFTNHKQHCPDALFFSSPKEIMRNKFLKEIKLEMDKVSVSILRNIIANIATYKNRSDLTSSPLVYYQILSVLELIRETAAKLNIHLLKEQAGDKELASYIHQHIYEPGLLQIKNIAEYFNIAPGYFSAYFKRNFGVSYRNYVNEYRIKLIEKRLSVPVLTIQEIANEFGFADVSHLSHYFKTYRKIGPNEYRKKGLSKM
ncbi:AraC family transcriptional regulator [Myroides odoratimimus]|uniref:AraC family transcriptional regulator n=1 Tax=Myroides odoratimimus TaxID=76832 RepID=UPI0031010126